MTVTDRKMNFGLGFDKREVVVKRKLPFDICSISKRQIVNPACCKDGIYN